MACLCLAEVYLNYLVRLALRYLSAVSLDKHVDVLLEKRLSSFQLLTDYKCATVRLGPEERKCATDLGVRIYVHFRGLLPKYDLLKLAKVRHKALFVDSSVEETSTTALAASPCDQDKIKLAANRLTFHVSLDKVGEPVLRYALCLKLRVHVAVPTEIFLNMVLSSEAKHFIKAPLPLKITSQVVILREVESFGQVFGDLLDNISNFFRVVSQIALRAILALFHLIDVKEWYD